MIGRTFKRYWPWWATFIWLLVYEAFAATTKRVATLSRLVWRADAAWKYLPFVVVPFVALLLLHFFAGLWR